MLSDDTARSSSCPLLLSFLFNVNIIPATLSSSELAVVVPELGLGRRAGGWRQIPLHYQGQLGVVVSLFKSSFCQSGVLSSVVVSYHI